MKNKLTSGSISVLIILFLFLGIFILTELDLFPQQDSGFKFITNYSRKDYDNHPQNWAILQDNRGIIYVANNGSIMEYDGVSWRFFKIPNYYVRSLALDPHTNTVYIGGRSELGYLAPDNQGSLTYISLLQNLNKKQQSFGLVRRTAFFNRKIYFCSRKYLFCWDPVARKFQDTFISKERFDSMDICGDTLFVRDSERGLLELKKDQQELTVVPGGDVFTGKSGEIFMIAPYPQHRFLVAGGARGCFLIDHKSITPFPTDIDSYLTMDDPADMQLYHGIRLSSGHYGLATRRDGFFIIDRQGKLIQYYNRERGLPDQNVKYVYEDPRGNLWLGLGYGIAKIENKSPFYRFDERSGLAKNIMSVVRSGSTIYAGTTDGLFFLELPAARFQQVPLVFGNCWSLMDAGDSVLAATSRGLFQVRTGKIVEQVINKERTYIVKVGQSDPTRAWVGTATGLVVLQCRNGKWKEIRSFREIGETVYTLVEDIDNTLWLGTGNSAVRIRFQEDIDKPVQITRFHSRHGLPGDSEIKVYKAANHVIFATDNGLFKFDKRNEIFVPDTTFGENFAGGNGQSVFLLVEDAGRNIWFHSDFKNYLAVWKSNNVFKTGLVPFPSLEDVQVNALYPDQNGKIIWFARHDDLIYCDTSFVGKAGCNESGKSQSGKSKPIVKDLPVNFKVLIRRIMLDEKRIYNGAGETPTDAGHPRVIPYAKRNIQFRFVAPFYEGEASSVKYSRRLLGYSDQWSEWSDRTDIDYTNLDPGVYRFQVKAKIVYLNHESGETTYYFEILPPWYMKWWAYALYVIAFLLLIYLIVIWRSQQLRREKHKLETIVGERTKEINKKNLQLEDQTLKLKEQSDQLQEMAKTRSRFFANISHEFRTPLTLIMGPLEKMLLDAESRGTNTHVNMMMRNAQRLLNLINQLLDLSKFDSGKMRLQAASRDIVPFLKGITASFESLAEERDIRLDFQSEHQHILVFFDPEKMEEAVANLLSNAFKFTPAHGSINVSLAMEGIDGEGNREDSHGDGSGNLEISVADTGSGIPEEQLANIFDRFYQVENSNTGSANFSYKGTGIGLALVKEVISLHHGAIEARNREGDGTQFIIHLPLGSAHLEPGEMVEHAASGPYKYKKVVPPFLNEGVEGESATPTGVDPAEDSGGKEEKEEKEDRNIILVVEDNADVRAYIRSALEPEFKIVDAVNGEAGIEEAKRVIPDLIISDVMMPKADGYELCRQLKGEVKTSHIPIVLLTAKASAESKLAGLETGADDYITKPFNTRMLSVRIRNLIELRRQLQEKIQRQLMLQPEEISVSSVDREFIKELQKTIDKNLSDTGFNVEALCKALYMSRATLYRKVIALTGESPGQFIRSYRLKRGAQLLKNQFGNVTEVAFEVGFSSTAYFTQCFKEKFHQLPHAYQVAHSR